MEALKNIAKIREYCDYLEEHLLNISKAWKVFQDKCRDLNVVYDDNRMIVDWMAVSMKVGDSAEEYYLKNKHGILLPYWADKFVMDIFERLKK